MITRKTVCLLSLIFSVATFWVHSENVFYWIEEDRGFVVDFKYYSSLYASFDDFAMCISVSHVSPEEALQFPSDRDSIYMKAKYLKEYNTRKDTSGGDELFIDEKKVDMDFYYIDCNLSFGDEPPVRPLTYCYCAVIGDDSIRWYYLRESSDSGGTLLYKKKNMYYAGYSPESRTEVYGDFPEIMEVDENGDTTIEIILDCYKRCYILPDDTVIENYLKTKDVAIRTPKGRDKVAVSVRPYPGYGIDGIFEVRNVFDTQSMDYIAEDRFFYIPGVMFILSEYIDKHPVMSINGKSLEEFMRERNRE